MPINRKNKLMGFTKKKISVNIRTIKNNFQIIFHKDSQMNNKTTLMAVCALLTASTGTVNANTTPAPAPIQSSTSFPQFYAGLSGGFENLTGHRSEELISTDPASTPQTFSDNKKFNARADIALCGIAGFLWKVPNLPISIGPEIYLGQGSGSDVVKKTYDDARAGEVRTYSAEFKRKLFYGIMVRSGWNFWKEYFGFISLGADFSQFMTDRLMVTNAADNQNSFRGRKRLTGFLTGIGLEKRFGSMCVGIDFKRITYKQQNFLDTFNPTPGRPPNQLAFSAKPRVYSLSLRLSYFF